MAHVATTTSDSTARKMTTTNTDVFLLTAKTHQGDVRGQKELTQQNIATRECNDLLSEFVLMAERIPYEQSTSRIPI